MPHDFSWKCIEKRIVAKQEDHNSHMLVLPCIHTRTLFLLLDLYFKRCVNVLSEEEKNLIKYSEYSIVENKMKNWAEGSS